MLRAAAAAICAPASAEPTKTIGISFPHAGQPVVDIIMGYARKKAAVEGFKIIVDDPGDDLTKQVNTLDTWIDSHAVDAVVSAIPASPEVFGSAASRAVAAGIPWTSYAASVNGESAFLSWDHRQGGYELGTKAAESRSSLLSSSTQAIFVKTSDFSSATCFARF